MRYVNVNGQIVKETSAKVPYNNRAFRFGYGVFETMLFRGGVIQLKEYHWKRLFGAVEQLELIMPEIMDANWLEAEIKKTVKKNKLEKLCRVRLQIYAGQGGLYDGHNAWTEFVIVVTPEKEQITELNETGVRLSIAEGLQKSNDSLANLKSCSALIYSIAARQADKKGFDDALICNISGNIIESTIANIFWIKGDTIYTPPLSEGCIAGVMRQYLLEQLPMAGINIKEEPLTRAQLKAADGIFLTNAIRKIKWVSTIDDMTFKKDKVKALHDKIFTQ
ncbi:MAG: aminotransferase class IV [Flavipsychrobacter sp.]